MTCTTKENMLILLELSLVTSTHLYGEVKYRSESEKKEIDFENFLNLKSWSRWHVKWKWKLYKMLLISDISHWFWFWFWSSFFLHVHNYSWNSDTKIYITGIFKYHLTDSNGSKLQLNEGNLKIILNTCFFHFPRSGIESGTWNTIPWVYDPRSGSFLQQYYAQL